MFGGGVTPRQVGLVELYERIRTRLRVLIVGPRPEAYNDATVQASDVARADEDEIDASDKKWVAVELDFDWYSSLSHRVAVDVAKSGAKPAAHPGGEG
jgi:hypothetical protein